MSTLSSQNPRFVERRQESGAEKRQAIDQGRIERMNKAGELGIHTSYVDQIFTRQMRDIHSRGQPPKLIVVFEAALRGFLPETNAQELLKDTHGPLGAFATDHRGRGDRSLILHYISHFMARGRDECRRDPELAAPIAKALTEICSNPTLTTLADRTTFLNSFAQFEKLITSEAFIQSKPDPRQATPLTFAVLDFQTEHWNPSGLMFWDDPLTKLLFAVRQRHSLPLSAQAAWSQATVMTELQKERESLLARGLQERPLQDWRPAEVKAQGGRPISAANQPSPLSGNLGPSQTAQEGSRPNSLNDSNESPARLSDKIKQRRQTSSESQEHGGPGPANIKKRSLGE